MSSSLQELLERECISVSAPCRIDMGGTLDISTFYYPLRHLNPCTFNIALDLRTAVTLRPFEEKGVKVSSKGFDDAVFSIDDAPFDHPLGLIFTIAAYFRAEGVHIDIASESPPRSALGGSSVAAVALIGALSGALYRVGVYRQLYRREIAILAHALEESVAGVPCGLQDQLAAAYGGVNAWHWHGRVKEAVFEKEMLVKKSRYSKFEKHLLLAYCGAPHESKDINGRWVRQFISGEKRDEWTDIIRLTHQFVDAVSSGRYAEAAEAMNRETRIRREMTPDVLDETGEKLAEAAFSGSCGFRFAGAGGGGCVWALGETDDIDRLREIWQGILNQQEGACLLTPRIAAEGLTVSQDEQCEVYRKQ